MHVYTLVLVGLQSTVGVPDNGCQFSRRGAVSAVEFRMPVWFFLLLPPLASANHHRDDVHQNDSDGHQDHQLIAPKVEIFVLMTNQMTLSVTRRFDDLYILARWKGWVG